MSDRGDVQQAVDLAVLARDVVHISQRMGEIRAAQEAYVRKQEGFEERLRSLELAKPATTTAAVSVTNGAYRPSPMVVWQSLVTVLVVASIAGVKMSPEAWKVLWSLGMQAVGMKP